MTWLADIDIVTVLAVVFAAGGGWVQLRNLGKRLDRMDERIESELRDIRTMVFNAKWRSTSG